MSSHLVYRQFSEAEFEKIEMYSKAIAKVHGKHHPELNQVHNLFVSIKNKTETSVGEIPNLENEFDLLHQVTNGYQVPADGCETYQITYNLLQQAEKAYSKC